MGVTSHEALSMWSGLTFSITFLISAIVSPMWGSLADRKGRKLMLLRASLGMAIAILLQAFATNVWQLFLLRGVMGLTSGYIPNAMALVASQVPRERSGWALSTLSTAQISGVIGGPLMGGVIADHIGLRAVFFITATLLMVSFLVTLFLIKEGVRPALKKSERLSGKAVFASLPYPGLVISLFFTTMVIQLCNGSISPILALFIKSMLPDSTNIAFLSGLIASVPGVSALISAPPPPWQTWRQDRDGKDSDGDAGLCRGAVFRHVVGDDAVPVGGSTFSVRFCRWRDAACRTDLIGEVFQRSNNRPYLWL